MKNILVPTDFSANSMKALRFAMKVAEKNNAKVHVIHQTSVLELAPDSAFTGLYMPSQADQVDYLQNELSRFISKARKSLKIPAGSKTLSGEVVPGVGTSDILVQTAKRLKADCIIMGSTGASGLKRLFIGSIAAQVIEKAPVPVIVIPDNFRHKEIRKIGYSSDLAHIEDELAVLLPVAKSLGADVEIFHIQPTFPTTNAFIEFDPEKAIPALKKKFKLNELHYKLVKTKQDNDFFGGVSKYRRTSHPDMICTVTHKRSWVEKILDPSKSKAIAYHNELPVVCIKVGK
ncbi:MAG: universal stress protein [Bacteroidetes bacterium]|nr:universal stress protein [Bacteroidota bacterium]